MSCQKKDQIDEELGKLPTFKMDSKQQEDILEKVKLKSPKRQGLRFLPIGLSTIAFIAFVVIGSQFLNNEIRQTEVSTTELNDPALKKELTKYFKGVKSLDIGLPITILKIPESMEKGAVAAYLMEAAIYVNSEGNWINPVEQPEMMTETDFELSPVQKQQLKNNYSEDGLASEAKGTLVLLNEIKNLNTNEVIDKQVEEWINRLNNTSPNKSFDETYKIYASVSQELIGAAGVLRETLTEGKQPVDKLLPKAISTSDFQNIKWEKSSIFKIPVTFGDGTKGEYALYGQEDKYGMLVGSGTEGEAVIKPIQANSPDKYMLFFNGEQIASAGITIAAMHKETGEIEQVLVKEGQKVWLTHLSGPYLGYDANAVTLMEFSKPGLWAINFYLDGTFYGQTIIEVEN
ncbi:hypothetical protein NC797_11695 [Aquibacillus sp. 3ASR75-11]|uniref:DUF4871 domain-containing protein n=1 Tax=Terrihalobacillus insolitus TaxID=2950438 RepID=A0A9X3WVV7_9BACI|nr:hypothetical protein [Terrihalobacillus insolitus]MDC3425166.1 hypothetical protein [Terrihalobacillus insolitus]